MCPCFLQGQLLPKNIIRAAYSRIRFRNPPKNLSGNNALHEQTMAGRYQYLLMENISTQRTDTIGSTCFNLGVFSSMNRLNGLGMNILGSVTGRDVNGVQMAGLSNMVGEACEACR